MKLRMNLAHQLLGGFTGKRKRTPDIQSPAQLQQHWLVVMPKRTCKMCSLQKIRTEPKTGCEQCEINLCIKCFKPYQTEISRTILINVIRNNGL